MCELFGFGAVDAPFEYGRAAERIVERGYILLKDEHGHEICHYRRRLF